MKIRHILISCFLITLQLTVQAQNVTIGVEAGIAISSVHVNPISVLYGTGAKIKSKPGSTIGALINVPIAKGVSIEPGIFYIQSGFKLAGNNYTSYEARYRFNYVQIPIFCKYSIKGAYIGIGPYVGIAASARTKVITTDTTATVKRYIGNADTDAIRRMDAGIAIKVSYVSSIGLFASLQYNAGLMNVLPSSITAGSIKNMSFSVCLGYYFGKQSTDRKKKKPQANNQ